ncbi:MAG: hypothetical protein LBU82_04065 [Treponema sp.]|nr:hypothetical protein [Treponema sp.]
MAWCQEFTSPQDDAPLEKLHKILDSPDFGGEEDSWGIRFKNKGKFPEINFNPSIEKLRRVFAIILRLMLIAIISGLIVFLLFYLSKFKAGRTGGRGGSIISSSHDKNYKTPESLLKRAAVFYEQGNERMAWGCCAAAAVLSWTLCHGVVFPVDATESECVELINSKAGDGVDIGKAQKFCRLMQNWTNLAYAGKTPPEGSFQEAINFCEALRNRDG